MKFIHTADIHYGAEPDFGKIWSQERSDAVKSSLDKIVAAANAEKADAVFICGDLFSSIPTAEDIKIIDEKLSETQSKVYIIPGSSDHMTVSSPMITYEWKANVEYLPVESAATLTFGNAKVMLRYGGDENNLPVDAASVVNEGIAYIALGGQHKTAALFSGKVVYPGSPEPLGQDETGKHGYYVGEIDEEAGRLTSLSMMVTAQVRYISLVVEVTPVTTAKEVINNLRSEMTRRGADNIYKIRLRGQCRPDTKFNLDILKNDFRIGTVVDETEPKYDFQKLFEDHPSDMLGFFVQKMNNENNSDIDRKALYFGVNALIKTADERK